MISGNVVTVFIAAAYLVLVLGIGEYARRSTRLDREDFFMASRSFGTIVLLFTILATNITAFVVIGAPESRTARRSARTDTSTEFLRWYFRL